MLKINYLTLLWSLYLKRAILISFFISATTYASNCSLVENQGIEPNTILGKKLSVFWSQEYSGADLVKKDLSELNLEKKVLVTIFDSGFEEEFIKTSSRTVVDSAYMRRSRRVTAHHGTSIANIINGDGLYGVSNNVEFLGLRNVKVSYTYKREFERYEKNGVYPKIISNSYGWSNTELIKNLSLKASDNGILWFLASGNDFPKPISEVENSSGAILIGSHSPSGLQSLTSQVSENVITLAGGDDYQASIDGKGSHTNFGGTSGATPIVAGSAANIASLLPSISKSQFIKLIKKTNLTSFEVNNRLDYAPGLFNAYKAFRVARNIALKCIGQNENSCVTSELDNPLNYTFDELIAASPLTEDILNKERECSARKRDLESLRKNSLLIDSPILWERLESIYKVLGYHKNSEFYGNLKTRFELTRIQIMQMEIGALDSIKNEQFFSPYFRYQEFFSEGYQKDLVKMLIENNKFNKYWITHFLVDIKEYLTDEVISLLKDSRSGASLDLQNYINEVLERS